jgi:hypothetical protein
MPSRKMAVFNSNKSFERNLFNVLLTGWAVVLGGWPDTMRRLFSGADERFQTVITIFEGYFPALFSICDLKTVSRRRIPP